MFAFLSLSLSLFSGLILCFQLQEEQRKKKESPFFCLFLFESPQVSFHKILLLDPPTPTPYPLLGEQGVRGGRRKKNWTRPPPFFRLASSLPPSSLLSGALLPNIKAFFVLLFW